MLAHRDEAELDAGELGDAASDGPFERLGLVFADAGEREAHDREVGIEASLAEQLAADRRRGWLDGG
jgi:hypothetical protein